MKKSNSIAAELTHIHWRLHGLGLVPALLVRPDEEQPLGEERGELGGTGPGRAQHPGPSGAACEILVQAPEPSKDEPW